MWANLKLHPLTWLYDHTKAVPGHIRHISGQALFAALNMPGFCCRRVKTIKAGIVLPFLRGSSALSAEEKSAESFSVWGAAAADGWGVVFVFTCRRKFLTSLTLCPAFCGPVISCDSGEAGLIPEQTWLDNALDYSYSAQLGGLCSSSILGLLSFPPFCGLFKTKKSYSIWASNCSFLMWSQ